MKPNRNISVEIPNGARIDEMKQGVRDRIDLIEDAIDIRVSGNRKTGVAKIFVSDELIETIQAGSRREAY